ncbi:HAD family hydrolase [Paratractidigestivibacter sp.]|uniref:HAD family hydrolase n=1 Tax=Paratractidigestivibacter sp. TaxID=2847316 RepID=UPI002AC8DE22|nr:HAD family hydrolase [Paratractidigestivibacter sp.]
MINKEQVKLVVTDEDGTFLDLGGEDFSRERFGAVFARMREAGCRFAVATSNQSFQVEEIFGELAPQISIIGSNGAYVHPEGSDAQVSVASEVAVERVLAAHEAYPAIPLCAVCADGAFCERGADEDFVAEMTMYSHNMRLVDSLTDAEARKDVLMYWSRVNEGRLADSILSLRRKIGEAMDVVDSGVGGGYGYFDVIQQGVSKASGIRVLLASFDINESQVMAFGDAGNDIEMLRLAGVGVAMGNASDEVKAAADVIAEPCLEQGVLKVLEQVFGR